MAPTIEEYSALIRAPSTIPNKIYWKEQKKPKYQKQIGRILGMEEYSMEMFALAIYGLVIFPKVLGHVEMDVVDFFG
ncbi:hypothetical protein REPUB_Repub05bG0116600 [Reevesia pubescens]